MTDLTPEEMEHARLFVGLLTAAVHEDEEGADALVDAYLAAYGNNTRVAVGGAFSKFAGIFRRLAADPDEALRSLAVALEASNDPDL